MTAHDYDLSEQNEWLGSRPFDRSRRVIAYDTSFIPLTGSPITTLFLSQAVYWQTRMGAGEWWWKTSESWQGELGVTRRHLDAARAKLKDLGILEERRGGAKGTMFYRVVVTKVMELTKTPKKSSNGGCVQSKPLSNGGCVQSERKSSSSIIDDHKKDLSDAAAPHASEQPRQRGLHAGQLGRKKKLGQEGKLKTPATLQGGLKGKRGTYEETSETPAQKAARLAARAIGAAGRETPDESFGRALSVQRRATSRRRKRPKDPFESACAEGREDDLKHDPLRNAVAQRTAAEKPSSGAGFDAWSDYAQDQVRRPARHGGGIKSTDEWNGPDLDKYLGILVAATLDVVAPPNSMARTRKQAKDFISDLTATKAREYVDYVIDNWVFVSKTLKIKAPAPTVGIIAGYLESIKVLMVGGTIGDGGMTGADRVRPDAEYDSGPKVGW